MERGYFEADAKSDKPPYTIVIPPPNVTGSLHLGHAFEHTLIDALNPPQRMLGYETLWQPGMDHAGIATQNVVERELGKEGKSRTTWSREAFVERVWQWKAESGGQISGQMRRPETASRGRVSASPWTRVSPRPSRPSSRSSTTTS